MTESPSAWITVSWTSEGLRFALGGLLAGWPDPDPPAPPRSAADQVRRLGTVVPPDAPFSITTQWCEVVIYWEGDEGFRFLAGWGAEPPVLSVPSAEIWDRVTPEWLHGRRDVVVARLIEHSGHVVRDDWDSGYLVAPEHMWHHR